jgi:hypothetical protein
MCAISIVHGAGNDSVEPMLAVDEAVSRSENTALLSTEPTKESNPDAEKRVTYVYGVSAKDYLPEKAVVKATYRPKVRRSYSGLGSKDVPDALYFVGGPLLLTILLGLMGSFIKEFEIQRREEMVETASEQFNPE